jgi:hypothetical protein
MVSRRALAAMQALPTALRAPFYKRLYRRHGARYSIDPDAFAGRHVLVLGPAASVLDDLAGLAPHAYDDVVRLNNGLDTPIAVEGQDPLRCDVLFHSLTDDLRPVTAEALRRAGVRLMVHRTPKRSTFLATLQAEATLGQAAGVRIAIVPVAQYEALRADLAGAAPSSGFVCLDLLLRAPVASLTVVGFTFFSTRYVAGYDDRFATDADARARMAAAGHHDPRREAQALARRFEAAQDAGMDLRLGAAVRAALHSPADAAS